MSKSENAADNLTGVWNGMFRQVLVGSVAFTATLIESGQHIHRLDPRGVRQFYVSAQNALGDFIWASQWPRGLVPEIL
ncbi:MAG: hypothetical protein ACLQFW_14280 [Xanthobacteraceae bacterium]